MCRPRRLAAPVTSVAGVATKTIEVKGGEKLQAHLREVIARLGGTPAGLKVGFLEGATYPSDDDTPGLPVATVAFWNEFGTTKQPPRPFFRNAIKKNSPEWGAQLGAALKASNYDARTAMGIMGEVIKGQVVQSIVDTHSPALAPSTIKRKGFAKPLIDTGVMQRSVDYTVVELPAVAGGAGGT